MTTWLAALLALGIGMPHLLRLDRVAPSTAIAIWLSALLLRALTATFFTLFIVVYLPTTELFTIVSHWCLHEVVPFLTWHLGLDGHRVGDMALVAPASALVVSLLWVSIGVWRATRRVNRLLVRRSIGRGPRESLIVGDGEVFVATAGLRHPEVLVSAGALTTFDDDELAASLEHEHGHIARGHRFVLLVSELCRAIARFVPGTRAAAYELNFHIERDADRFASATQEPLALASAICKAATGQKVFAPAIALTGGGAVRRVKLLAAGLPAASRREERGSKVVAIGLVVLVFGAISMLPGVVHASYHGTERDGLTHCTS